MTGLGAFGPEFHTGESRRMQATSPHHHQPARTMGLAPLTVGCRHSPNGRNGWKAATRYATLADMRSLYQRLAIVSLTAMIFAVQPAQADLPQFVLQTAPNGSLAATMGREIRVWCDLGHKQIVLEYFDDDSLPVTADEPLGFVDEPFAESQDGVEAIEMRVALEGPGHLTGRAPADDKLLRVLEAEHMAVIAPSEMGEPLYTGRSEALLHIAKSCRD